ncbi:MAG: hypothetical protein ACOYT4_03245 [Nanoarchaeota archaeon]
MEEIIKPYNEAILKARKNSENQIKEICNKYSGVKRISLAEADCSLLGICDIQKIDGFENTYLFTRSCSWENGRRTSGVVFEDKDNKHLNGLINSLNETHIIGGIVRDCEADDYPRTIFKTIQKSNWNKSLNKHMNVTEYRIENPVINWFFNQEHGLQCYQICGIDFDRDFVYKVENSLRNGEALE